MQYPKKVTIDTSIFINPDSFRLFGKNSEGAFCTFIEKAREKKLPVYMPPSILNETLRFLNKDKIDKKTISFIRKKPPKKYEIFVPSLFLYEFVEESRARINKGLRIAEKYCRYAYSKRKTEQELIKAAREEYRTALREGIIDSKQDIDLLILAKEISSPLISSDEGLLKWAKKLGIECISSEEIKELLFTQLL